MIDQYDAQLCKCVDLLSTQKRWVECPLEMLDVSKLLTHCFPESSSSYMMHNSLLWILSLDIFKSIYTSQASRRLFMKTKQGLYEWLVILFRLWNAQRKFICLMNDILRPILDSFVFAYLYFILVYSKIWEEHMWLLVMALQILKQYKSQDRKEEMRVQMTSLIVFWLWLAGATSLYTWRRLRP